MSEKFRSELFVGRERELEDLVRWATDIAVPSRRLRTIAAPPGYGKTWLLKQLVCRLAEWRDLFIITAPTLTLTSYAAITKWLLTVIEQAGTVCAKMSAVPPDESLEAWVRHLLENLTQNSPSLRPILIVDGLNELADNERRELEKYLLDQFWLNPEVRIIVSFREESYLIPSNPRRGEKRISLETFSKIENKISADGHQQLHKRATIIPEKLEAPLEEFLEIVAPYALTVPGLNTILFRRARENEANHRRPILNANDLKESRYELIGPELRQKPETVKTIEDALRQIVALQENSWILENFAGNKYTQREALNHIQTLMVLSIVTHIGGQRYQIVDGLRELLYAENRLREKEKENKQ
ncbi:MAG: hypothetical protein JW953_21650 [Anaerolineae bacterium]|nr:hypothetical protein [Anaerolineae bacterium]